MNRFVVAGLLVFASACADGPVARMDASPSRDGGTADGETPDAGALDAEPTDADATPDAGVRNQEDASVGDEEDAAVAPSPTIDSAAFGDGTVSKTVDPGVTDTVRVIVRGENLPVDGADVALSGDLAGTAPTFRPGPSSDTQTVVRIRVTKLADGPYAFAVRIGAAISPPLELIVTSPSPDCTTPEQCSDGLVCNGEEQCVDEVCVAGQPIVCDDGLACTVDTCDDAAGGCVASGQCLTAADEDAAYRMLKSARRVQLQRPQPSHVAVRWLVVGPQSALLPGSGHLIDPTTAGVGDTLAIAVADYETKHSTSFGSGGSLTASESSLLDWYGRITPSGPTALRRDNQGGYHGEFYRQATGVQHGGPFPTLEDGLTYLFNAGL